MHVAEGNMKTFSILGITFLLQLFEAQALPKDEPKTIAGTKVESYLCDESTKVILKIWYVADS